MRRHALLLPVLLLPLAACGGDASADLKPAYLSDAQAACDRASTSFAGLQTPTAPAEFAPFVNQTLAIAETAQSELAALTPPEADRAELDSKVLDPFATLVEKAKGYAAQVEAAGTEQAALLPLLAQRPSADAIDLEFLRSYGLASCAEAIDDLG